MLRCVTPTLLKCRTSLSHRLLYHTQEQLYSVSCFRSGAVLSRHSDPIHGCCLLFKSFGRSLSTIFLVLHSCSDSMRPMRITACSASEYLATLVAVPPFRGRCAEEELEDQGTEYDQVISSVLFPATILRPIYSSTSIFGIESRTTGSTFPATIPRWSKW
jgi:hypothetical protein